ncbi:hypothetical protein [Pseudonocardia humida]|uniref:Membrane protein (TIGR02234 family) n=1 Tax=Pseudonocardia humida TaxID=2800819 RepID=A0ABT1AD14_9PSEU|nr:hypothetical protein [Pseudonocardia humida]MCO1660898.1 hypothetical protein [Pseudonocardia humida]
MVATAHRGSGPEPARTPDLIRWGPVVAGATIGLAVFALFSTLWLAVATGAGDDPVEAYLPWFMGATAAFALLLAGVVAGLFAGARGSLAGLANGVTAWGLLFVLSLTAIVPGAANLTAGLGSGLGRADARAGGALGGVTAESALWAGFWSLLVGLLLAALGGLIGGRVRRPVEPAEELDRTARPGRAVAPDRDHAADTDPSGTAATPLASVPEQRDRPVVDVPRNGRDHHDVAPGPTDPR